MNNYKLGILWSLGSMVENCFIIKHKNKYFLNQVQELTKNKIYKQAVKNNNQYVIKMYDFNIEFLKKLGWSNRNADIRNMPILEDYKEFLRAYIEIHSRLDYCTTYSYKRKYYRLRLRIYGNENIINSINIIFNNEIGTKIKAIGSTHNNKTCILCYTALNEIISIFEYLKGYPRHEQYWNDVNTCLKNPRKKAP